MTMFGRREGPYRVYPAIIAPIALAVASAVLGLAVSYWFFLAVPFAVLFAVCSAPHLNLADGFLVLMFAAAGGILFACNLKLPGIAIAAGSIAGWLAGAIEKNIRMKPMEEVAQKTKGGGNEVHPAARAPEEARAEDPKP